MFVCLCKLLQALLIKYFICVRVKCKLKNSLSLLFLIPNLLFMSQDNLIKLRCKKCKEINYHSSKNKKTVKEKIELKKHCPFCRKHTDHVEMKGK